MPSGGDAFYYFSIYLYVRGDESAFLRVEINGEQLCEASSDLTEAPSSDFKTTSCSGVSYIVEGSHRNGVFKS